jgi:tetratricopeptide (TPR) repeat protein
MRIKKKEIQQKSELVKFSWPAFALLAMLIFTGCVSSLQKAKVSFAQAQIFDRSFKTEQAAGLYKKTLEEIDREIRKKPSAQAYLLKGQVEVKLEKWAEAEDSFRLAASLGEEKAGSWAKEVSLYGLALSSEQQGFGQSAARLYNILVEKGEFSPVVMASVGKLVDYQLKVLDEVSSSQKEKILSSSIKIVEKALADDPARGYYHYLLAQLLSHQKKYVESFEEAAMARELGLPSEKIVRDNDNQIIFCYQQLKQSLSQDEFERFYKVYNSWIKKWGWADEITPDWKRR